MKEIVVIDVYKWKQNNKGEFNVDLNCKFSISNTYIFLYDNLKLRA